MQNYSLSIFFLGFSYEFNSLTSSNELAEAYEFLMTPSRAIFSFIAGSIPFATQIPIDHNIRMDNACKVVEHESKRIIEKKYHEDKNNKLNGRDLLTLLININKTLPAEEKMTDEELKYQVIKIKKKKNCKEKKLLFIYFYHFRL